MYGELLRRHRSSPLDPASVNVIVAEFILIHDPLIAVCQISKLEVQNNLISDHRSFVPTSSSRHDYDYSMAVIREL